EKVKQRASYLVGIDFSRAMLAKARDKNKHFNNISFICGDSDFLPIREDVFNTVFSFTLLQNVPDPIRTLKEIIRVAKPQTLIVISALKKNYKKNEITNLIHKTNLKILESINHDFLNDYIYICENPLNKKLNHSNE
ncbi:class I SAM-dependent methyltransferase, partial [Candidatus Bathyarchaeota archaeon]|nr:class I SAM-dependent methyltransferase [Candidatus Bathyarchaeota archaeon]